MKKFLLGIIMVIGLVFTFSGFPGNALAQTSSTDAVQRQICQGISGQVGGNCNGTSSGRQLRRVIRAVLSTLSVIAGIAAVIMIVVSGLKYITSSGDPNSVSSAKRTLIYAIVGLVVVAFSQVIVSFVLTNT